DRLPERERDAVGPLVGRRRAEDPADVPGAGVPDALPDRPQGGDPQEVGRGAEERGPGRRGRRAGRRRREGEEGLRFRLAASRRRARPSRRARLRLAAKREPTVCILNAWTWGRQPGSRRSRWGPR